jgi:hypothetical protein
MEKTIQNPKQTTVTPKEAKDLFSRILSGNFERRPEKLSVTLTPEKEKALPKITSYLMDRNPTAAAYAAHKSGFTEEELVSSLSELTEALRSTAIKSLFNNIYLSSHVKPNESTVSLSDEKQRAIIFIAAHLEGGRIKAASNLAIKFGFTENELTRSLQDLIKAYSPKGIEESAMTVKSLVRDPVSASDDYKFNHGR